MFNDFAKRLGELIPEFPIGSMELLNKCLEAVERDCGYPGQMALLFMRLVARAMARERCGYADDPAQYLKAMNEVIEKVLTAYKNGVNIDDANVLEKVLIP